MCKSNNEVNRIINDWKSSSNEDDQDFNICTVNNFRFTSRSDCAIVTVLIGKESVPMKFKVDTGSQCNLIPKDMYKKLKNKYPSLHSNYRLSSYTNNPIPVYGKVNLPCKYRSQELNDSFYVVSKKSPALLSLETSADLGLIKLTYAIDKQPVCLSIDKQTVLTEYNDLFQGIGLFPGFSPCSMPTSPRTHCVNHLKREVKSMEEKGIIKKVTKPTEWVNALVCVEKPASGKLRICLDPKALNNCIL